MGNVALNQRYQGSQIRPTKGARDIRRPRKVQHKHSGRATERIWRHTRGFNPGTKHISTSGFTSVLNDERLAS